MKMKDSGIEWIGKIPKGWEVSRIKQLFSEVNERCENSENYKLLSVSEYYGVAPKNEKISDSDMLTHAETLNGYKICKENDLVMNIMLAWKRALGMSEYPGIVSPAYCIYRAKQNMCTKYFHYLFRTDVYANLFKQYSTGIIDSRLRLYPDKFLALKCQVPPIDMQYRIADYLDCKCSQIDAIISKQQEVIEKLKEYKLSVITENVTKGLNPDIPMKDSGVEWIGEIPKNWQILKTRYVVNNICDIDHYMPTSVESGIPYVMTGDLKEFSSEINFQSCKKISIDDYIKLSNKVKVEKGDLIFARYATIGTICYVDSTKDFLVSYSCVIIKPDIKLIEPKFLMYYYKSSAFSEEIAKYFNSNTQSNIGKDSLYKAKVCLPLLNEQIEIVNYLNKKCNRIERLIKNKQKLISKLAKYKKFLIYEVVTGKKEV